MIFLCPLCGSADFETDEDNIITYCYCCEENADGYRPQLGEDDEGVIY
ncbi:hypothetical protein [Methanobrevibacter olleyae]|uniref:Uncharacterized protein n=1 Tax=Methanobrevibacter olleyae TaxID=294671 RepID=A0A126R2T1_METOL|nr:hypothetical protein [Methanobrevibacter olleyae]AMK16289.1 hypothetical protein YLM1_1734 [Methanobrevibacter olleyae]